MDSRPIIAITMGNAAGVGPEIVVKALATEKTGGVHPSLPGRSRGRVDSTPTPTLPLRGGGSEQLYALCRPLVVGDAEGLPQMGIEKPRLGVAALNPHGGEGGLLGREEIEVIAPAVEAAQALGIDARGPYPADSIFFRAIAGEFDAVVAMYHDQGHIPVKTHGFETSVTVTLGLPFVRTSVDHGTAFDIAWQGLASPQSLIEAIRLAVDMAKFEPH